jgi:hypothetical protein
VAVDRLTSVRTFTRLFDALATHDNGVCREDGPDAWAAAVELWFLFALIWGVGGTLDADGRKRFDGFMRWGRGSHGSSKCMVLAAVVELHILHALIFSARWALTAATASTPEWGGGRVVLASDARF